jgi:hypothetical protein
MKKLDLFGVSKIRFYFLISCVLLGNHVFANLNVTDHYIIFDSGCPPSEILVTDSTGAQAGVDTTKPLDQIGTGTSISQIAGSYVEQMNIGTDEGGSADQPQASTSWTIYVSDQPAQSYLVSLVGLKTGVAFLNIGGGYHGKQRPPIPMWQQSFLMAEGVTKTIEVNYDPSAASLTITPNIKNGDLLADTQSACGQGTIGPIEACKALESLAEKFDEAQIKSDLKVERADLLIYLAVLDHLHNWGKDGHRKDWDEFKDKSECAPLFKRRWDGVKVFANDPVYSALKLDAQTLLNTLPKDGNDGHGGGGKDGGDRH